MKQKKSTKKAFREYLNNMFYGNKYKNGKWKQVVLTNKDTIPCYNIIEQSPGKIILETRKGLYKYEYNEEGQGIYTKLTASGVEVLFDDRNESAGAKFADSDLIGIPMRVVVSDKSIPSISVNVSSNGCVA